MTAPLLVRDEAGVAHVVALSGGDDSTCLAFALKEREPREYNYLCSPTGDELPEMFTHWNWLGDALGRKLIPIMAGKSLFAMARDEGIIPNFQRRWCTRKLKIYPFIAFLREQLIFGPIIAYVGLRADEPLRVGGVYGNIEGIEQRFPLREWGFDDPMVHAFNEQRGIIIPERTDCARCYHQRIGEWWRLWKDHRDLFVEAVEFEAEMGGTFRTPARKDGEPVWREKGGFRYLASSHDTWPVRLADMMVLFERGFVPTIGRDPRTRDLFRSGPCRTCSL